MHGRPKNTPRPPHFQFDLAGCLKPAVKELLAALAAHSISPRG
jgi:hypothetical protein